MLKWYLAGDVGDEEIRGPLGYISTTMGRYSTNSVGSTNPNLSVDSQQTARVAFY